MPKVISDPTTTPPASPSIMHTQPQLLPFTSVYAIGVAACAAFTEGRRLDRAFMALPKHAQPAVKNRIDSAMKLQTDRGAALHEMTALFPAKDLQDAAAQLHSAYVTLDWIDAVVMSEGDLSQEILRIRRLVLSCLPIVAAAADVNLDDLGGDSAADFAAMEFLPTGWTPAAGVQS
jgi:hypothetical protein